MDLHGVVSLPSPFPELPGTVRLLDPPADVPPDIAQRLLDRRYTRPYLIDSTDRRYLLFNLDFIQSEMRLTDPLAIDTLYVQRMLAYPLLHTRVRRALLLGLGGGSLAKFILHHFAACTLEAVEASADVLAFRNAFHIPADSTRFTVHCADAAEFVCEGTRVRQFAARIVVFRTVPHVTTGFSGHFS